MNVIRRIDIWNVLKECENVLYTNGVLSSEDVVL